MWNKGDLPAVITMNELLVVQHDLYKYPISEKPSSMPSGKAKNAAFESIDRNLYLPSAKMCSFRLHPSKKNIEAWICALTARYYNCVGSNEGWTCEWVNITDGDGGPVSCIYIKIDQEEETLFTARLFLKTHLITIQGNRLNEWCDWEFPILKQAVDNLMNDSEETLPKLSIDSHSDSNKDVSAPVSLLAEEKSDKSTSNDGGHIGDTKHFGQSACEKVFEDGSKKVGHKQTTVQDACFEAELSAIKSSLDTLNNRLSILEHSLTSIKELYSNTTHMLDKSSKIDQLFESFDKLNKKMDKAYMTHVKRPISDCSACGLHKQQAEIAQRELVDVKNKFSTTESAHFSNLDMKLEKLVHLYDTIILPTECSSCESNKNRVDVANREITELKSKLASADNETKLLNSKVLENIHTISDLKRRNDLLTKDLEYGKSDVLKLREELECALDEKSRANVKALEYVTISEERQTMIDKLQDQILTLNQANQPDAHNPWMLQAQNRTDSSQKKSVVMFSDSIGKGIEITRLCQGSRLSPDRAIKKVVPTIEDLNSEADKLHYTSEVIIAHVGVNNLKSSNFVNEKKHVDDYLSAVTTLTEKCEKLIISLVAPTDAHDDMNLFFRSIDFNNKISREFKDKSNIICDNSNFAHRGEIIHKLFDSDQIHLSNEGIAVFAANLKHSIRLATGAGSRNSSARNNDNRITPNGDSHPSKQGGTGKRGKSRERGRPDDDRDNKLVTHLKNLLSNY